MKINRNNKCECGSNKKYKNCCGKIEQKKSNYNFANILFLSVGILFIGITIYTMVQKPLSTEDGKELEWCENCQTYH